MEIFRYTRLLDVICIMILCACSSCSEIESDSDLKTDQTENPVPEIILSESDVHMKVGEIKILNARVHPDTTNMTLMWTSSDESIVKVKRGRLTALKAGSAKIWVGFGYDNSKNACCSVTVSDRSGEGSDEGNDIDGLVIPVESITLSTTSISIYLAQTETIEIESYRPSDATELTFTWTSDTPAVATVDQYGTVTGVSEGEATITVMCGNAMAICYIEVINKYLKEYEDEYGINHGYGVKIGNVLWAPVNCGYHAKDFPYGKLYQWGRKYGQGLGYPYDKGILTFEKGGVSLIGGQHLNNAETFYIDEEDWLYTSNDKLWNSGTESHPQKGEYDPCPEGWRVPVVSELEELSENRSEPIMLDDGIHGVSFSGPCNYSENAPQIFLPAPGRRDSDGALIEDRGFYWSLSYLHVTIDRSNNMFFYYSSLDWSSWNNRAQGNAVRCVQE